MTGGAAPIEDYALVGLRDDVGLLAEEYDPSAGRQLGDTPQTFGLVGLVNAARRLGGA